MGGVAPLHEVGSGDLGHVSPPSRGTQRLGSRVRLTRGDAAPCCHRLPPLRLTSCPPLFRPHLLGRPPLCFLFSSPAASSDNSWGRPGRVEDSVFPVGWKAVTQDFQNWLVYLAVLFKHTWFCAWLGFRTALADSRCVVFLLLEHTHACLLRCFLSCEEQLSIVYPVAFLHLPLESRGKVTRDVLREDICPLHFSPQGTLKDSIKAPITLLWIVNKHICSSHLTCYLHDAMWRNDSEYFKDVAFHLWKHQKLLADWSWESN